MARKAPERPSATAPPVDRGRASALRRPVRNLVPSVDLFEPGDALELDDDDRREILRSKVADVTHFRVGLASLRQHALIAREIAPTVRPLPRLVRGVLRNPGGGPATRVSVQPTLPGEKTPLGRGVLTDGVGLFSLPLPAVSDAQRGAILAQGLGLKVTGAGNVSLALTVALPAADGGALGELTLAQGLEPLPDSLVGALIDLVDDLPGAGQGGADGGAATPVKVEIGQGACSIQFAQDTTVRRFPYKMLVRLVEPRTTNVVRVFDPVNVSLDDVRVGRHVAALWNTRVASLLGVPRSRFVERVPIDKPISVDAFRDNLIGLEGETIGNQRRVPMAGTLGLGYVLSLAQVWKYDGLTLGNLLYSLPLAPGEQQRIAIAERVATASVSDTERLDIVERQHSSLREDSSAQATFDSAFEEHVAASSSYRNEARSSSWGVAGGIGAVIPPVAFGIGAGGGGGKSSNSGNTRSALDGVRTYTSEAAEAMHRNVERQASARRSAQRTAIRLATETDRETVTTKVITNHNKMHALTMQYWEVLRRFTATTDVEGVSLVCFVPLDLVRFLPQGQPLDLPSDTQVDTRGEILRRYELLHRHADAIQPYLPMRHREGLRLLDDFVSDPRALPNFQRPSMPTITFSLQGSFLPFERVWVDVLLRRGRRVGPVALDSPLTALVQREHGTRASLIAALRKTRDEGTGTVMTGSASLPEDVDPAEVVGFELRRAFNTLDYELDPEKNPEYAALLKLEKLFGGLDVFKGLQSSVRLAPRELEAELGGPRIANFSALVAPAERLEADSLPTFREFPPSTLPIAASQRQPTLGYRELLLIERTLQHVVRNTMTYSKAVWLSLTPEERVVLLEGFTIGLPEGGLDPDAFDDPSQHVPLLNCVANEVLGFYGNCMILPFSIPAALAAQLGQDESGAEREPLTTGAVQEALTRFHKEAFSSPTSHFTLPTRGVLGEAVLGHCPSAEKIDLTRFWNWQDSPADEATAIADVGLRGNSLAQLTAPSTLTGQPTIINNVAGEGGATGTTGSLVAALAARAPQQQDFSDAFLGQDVLKTLGGKTIDSAESARKDALASATQMASKALDAGVAVFKTKLEMEKAEKDQQEKDKKEAEAKAAADKKALADKQAAAAKDLKKNAKAYLTAATAKEEPQRARDFADGILTSLAGGPLPAQLAATLFADYDEQPTPGTRSVGSEAWLRALGLIEEE